MQPEEEDRTQVYKFTEPDSILFACTGSQSSENLKKFTDEPDSQVVQYACPLEREAQDLLFSLAEVPGSVASDRPTPPLLLDRLTLLGQESLDTGGGTTAIDSASERERNDQGCLSRKRRMCEDYSDVSKRRRSALDEVDEEAASHEVEDRTKEKEENNSYPWNSRGSGTGTRTSAPSLEKNLTGISPSCLLLFNSQARRSLICRHNRKGARFHVHSVHQTRVYLY